MDGSPGGWGYRAPYGANNSSLCSHSEVQVWNGETIAIAQLNRKTDHREHKNGANLHQGFKLSDISNQKQIVADFCYYKRQTVIWSPFSGKKHIEFPEKFGSGVVPNEHLIFVLLFSVCFSEMIQTTISHIAFQTFQIFQTYCILNISNNYRLSGNLPDCQETYQTVRKLTILAGNFVDCSKTFH